MELNYLQRHQEINKVKWRIKSLEIGKIDMGHELNRITIQTSDAPLI